MGVEFEFVGEKKRKEKGKIGKHILWQFLTANIFKLLMTSNFNGWKDQFESIYKDKGLI